jgi:hypothetical protein
MAKKADKKQDKKSDKKKLNEHQEIVKFLSSISQKNYSEANKYLQNVIDSKLKAKIGEALKEKLF